MSRLIERVNSPSDLKRLTLEELKEYSREVREYVLSVVERQGGHLSSNLGAVELTVALHYVFDSPNDKLIFDVGHQTYAHKLITGRREAFERLREDGGISGFPNAAESNHDHFTVGHSSTSLSLGLGMARARELKGENYDVVSVIGDGAFTGGEAFEALNDIGAHKDRMIIVLNDNEMSISHNVGAFSEYLSRLRLSKKYSSLKRDVKRAVSAMPFFGDRLARFLDDSKEGVKGLIIRNKIFEDLGVKYFGPIDGHDLGALIDMLKMLKRYNKPALLHVVTQKGRGVDRVRREPSKYHGVAAANAEKLNSYSELVSQSLCELASRDERVAVVTAAMADGTGTAEFGKKFPRRFFDVGIAEQHATTLCAGLAKAGMKPYFAVYSTFLQRAYDQVLHDVCLNDLPVTFLVDHAGFVEGDGATHQGAYDISYLSAIPSMTIFQPKDGDELKKMLEFSLGFDRPLAIRYPKGYSTRYPSTEFSLGWEFLRKTSGGAYIVAAGDRAIDLAMKIDGASVISARVISPLDQAFIDELGSAKLVITIEDGVRRGGLGEAVLSALNERGYRGKFVNLGYDGAPACHAARTAMEKSGLTEAHVLEIIEKHLKND